MTQSSGAVVVMTHVKDWYMEAKTQSSTLQQEAVVCFPISNHQLKKNKKNITTLIS